MTIAFSRVCLAALAMVALAPPLARAAPADDRDAERARTEAIVRDYLLAHPEIVLEAERRARENIRRGVIEINRKAMETPYPGAAIGPADASVAIVEFMDYGCHYCRDTAPEIERLLAADTRVRLVLRQYPILSELSAQAARVALLAAEKGRFAAYHHALYAAPELSQEAILKAAADAGLDPVEARAAATDTRRDSEFAGNEALGRAIGATGTPTFLIGDEIYGGAMRQEALAVAVEKARRRSAAPAK